MSVTSALPVYRGKFGAVEAERLLWRAGFGPRPGEAQALAQAGLDGAVRSLTRPPAEKLDRPGAEGRARRAAGAGGRVSATTTSGGSTGWCARIGRSSSG